ncbi:outer membrane beta-barrel family protein [Lacibacter sp. H375]|uniref:outer membrane beta-barrel family protein n=1 Tax=Lacibacter sp. H375 TaxID=3133424 RepID=UPI0030C50B96
MKKISAFLTAALLTCTFSSFAQNASRVKGDVKDESQKPVSGVTVSLLRGKDSSLVKAAITDKSGAYSFESVKNGSYLLGITSVGYQKKISNLIEVKEGAEITVPSFSLLPEAKGLKEVTVTAKRPMFEQKADKLVVNVDASPTNAGANALEVLEKSPGITVDKDGNISLKGKAGVQVFIDGKPAYLSGADLANYLRNLQGPQLDQIEIMTNPPAKYDAAGNSGIINIKTKRTLQFGYNGSVTTGYTQGRYQRYTNSFTFNYRKNKVNLFANGNFNARNSFQELDIQRSFSNSVTKEVVSLFEQETRMIHKNRSLNGKVGMDFFASKKTTLGVTANGFYSPGQFLSTSDINIFNPDHILLSKTMGKADNSSTWRHFGSNLNFRHVFDTTGKEISADVDYLRYSATNTQSLFNKYENGSQAKAPDTLYGNLPQNIYIYTAKVDYVQPFKKGLKFEAGIKTSFVETDNVARYDSLINNTMQLDSARRNDFVYKENINAGYINFSKQLNKKISAQVGLRLENTSAKGYSKGYAFDKDKEKFSDFDTTFNLNYTQLFPTVYIQYAVNEKHSLGMNYGRRIRRPDYESLNPFVEFIDRYTYEQGNPNLRPQFSHNIEFSHTYKGFLTTTLNYTNTNNIIQEVLEQNEERNESYVKRANIAKQQQFGIAVSAFKQIKKWNGNIYVNVYNNKFEGLVNGDFVTLGRTTMVLSASNSYKFGKDWTTEISGFYRTAGYEGVFYIRPLGELNFGVSKPVLKGKGTLRLSVRDILWTQRGQGEIKYGLVHANFQQRRDSRTVGMTFTYRFSKGKINGNTRRKASGAADEQNRVKASE